MSTWAEIETGLIQIFQDLSELLTVQWEHAKGSAYPAPDQAAQIDLLVVSSVPLGDDARAYSEAPPGWAWGDPWGGTHPGALETIQGWRQITIRAKVTSFDQHPGRTARTYLERIRLRLGRSSFASRLAELGLGFASVAASVDLSVPLDQRVRSISAIDLVLNSIWTETDPNTLPTIRSAEL